jgi:hypothetical protein
LDLGRASGLRRRGTVAALRTSGLLSWVTTLLRLRRVTALLLRGCPIAALLLGRCAVTALLLLRRLALRLISLVLRLARIATWLRCSLLLLLLVRSWWRCTAVRSARGSAALSCCELACQTHVVFTI